MDRARQHEIVLVLQGGGALGSYQAGVFEALAGEGALFFAAFPSTALTGQCLVVSHGWFMQ